MKRAEMIKDKKYFNYIIKNGLYNKDKNFVIYSVDNDSNLTKFGIAIKKSIGSAVLRNRLKRQVRAIVDNNRNLFQLSKDYIIMIRENSKESSFGEMSDSIVNIMKGRKWWRKKST